MFTFEAPLYLLLFLLFPPAAYFRHLHRRRGNLVPFPFSIWRNVGFAPESGLARLVLTLSSLFFWAGAASIVIALAGPSLTEREKVFLNRGIDMMIVLDESPSMAARDFQPENRFEAARDVIRRFVQSRENDPIGLVTFGLEAALRVPPTLDYGSFLRTLDGLSIMDLGDGTAIGMGIAVACLHLKSSSAREKAVILLTDGKNNTGEINPDTAADMAARMGIRVYAIGIGGESEAHIEFTDPRTEKHYSGTLEGGFNEELLRGLAERTGGGYFFAGNPGTLNSIFQAIDSLETVERHLRVQVRTIPVHELFILAGLALLVLDYLIRLFLLREVP